MKVGILGGSFNPPHPGHIHISKLAMKKLALSQVWWVPALQNPLKENQSESYQNRLKLCEKALKKDPKFKIHKSEEVHSHKLVENLKKKYPKIEFIWVMGSDNLEQLHKWQNYKSFIASIKLAIFSRENSLITVKKTPVWNLLKREDPQIFLTKNLDISSTQIREENNE